MDARRLDLALRYAQPAAAQPAALLELLGACAQAKDTPPGRRVRPVPRHGLAPDAFAQRLISAAGKCGDLRSAEAVPRRR